MLGQIELTNAPAQTVVDEALRQLQAEVALHAGQGAFDVETILKNTLKDGIANLSVVVGFGGHVEGPGAEVLATATAGLVLGIVDVDPGLLAVGQGANTTTEGAFAVSALAAVRTGLGLGGATDDANVGCEHGLWSWEARGEYAVFLGRRAYLSRPLQVMSHRRPSGGGDE